MKGNVFEMMKELSIFFCRTPFRHFSAKFEKMYPIFDFCNGIKCVTVNMKFDTATASGILFTDC